MIEKVFPFLWIKGGEEIEDVINEVEKIYQSGARSICVESRGESGFLTDVWWEIVDAILAKAHCLGMQVWVLDDLIYPCGHANGELKNHPHLYAKFVKAHCVDVVGEAKSARVFYNLKEEFEEKVLNVFLVRRAGAGLDYSFVQDVSERYYNGTLHMDIPKGLFRVIFIVQTKGHFERPHYADMLNPASTQLMIDTVYEPHYQRYKKYFGNTFAGFFTDEPRFANGKYSNFYPTNAYQASIGVYGVVYPWNKEIEKQLKSKYGNFGVVGLWFDIGEDTPEIRFDYMDYITRAYAKNYSGKVGKWCEEHGALYCGHIIEDMGAHARTGCSIGHYFRSQEGQDISGVDVVLHQIKPYETEQIHFSIIAGGYADPTFFNYTLAKLASSCARIDPKKNGKALCEVFGAFGWGETADEMVQIINHMIVRGINHFIPHAFSLKRDDTDCPPHFYAHNTNPSYEAFGKVMEYTNFLLDIFKDGCAKINIGVLYHAEAEWTGKKYMPCDDVAKQLMQAQIDFDLLPYYALKNGNIVNGNSYSVLLVPYAQYLPKKVQAVLDNLNETCKVIYIKENMCNMPLVIEEIKADFVPSILLTTAKDVRILNYEKNGELLYFIVNEGNSYAELALDLKSDYVAQDIYTQEYRSLWTGQNCNLCLQPGEAAILKRTPQAVFAPKLIEKRSIENFLLSLKRFDRTEFEFYKQVGVDFDINSFDEILDFSGFLHYQTQVDLKQGERICVQFIGELCVLTVDESQVSSIKRTVVSAAATSDKKVSLSIRLNNTLAYAKRDEFTICKQVEGCRLLKVYVCKEE